MGRGKVDRSSYAGGLPLWLRSVPWLGHNRMQKAYPFVSSLMFHLLLFIVLALWVLPALTRGRDFSIDATLSNETGNEGKGLPDVLLQTSILTGAVTANSRQIASAVMAKTDSQPVSHSPTQVQVAKPRRVLHSALPAVHQLSDEVLATELGVPVSMMPIHAHRGETRVAEAESTGDIADQISGDLITIAKDGDATVVWLLDQSLSMQLDMKNLAEFLVTTLEQIEEDQTSRMDHTVVAFGDDVRVVQNRTTRGRRVAEAIYNLPADPSGVENTFQSVEWCVAQRKCNFVTT